MTHGGRVTVDETGGVSPLFLPALPLPHGNQDSEHSK